MKAALLVVLGIASLQAAFIPKARIVGGEDARVAQFPFAAAIELTRSNGKYFCGGALMSPEFVITAAQCVYDASLFTIQLGSIHLEGEDSNRRTVATGSYYQHPDYVPGEFLNDVGLIRLREPVVYSEYIRRILLAFEPLPENEEVIAIGWGQKDDANDALSNELQYVELVTIPNQECRRVYGDVIDENNLCVGGNLNEGTCLGDTGSPLLHFQTVSRSLLHVGIANFLSGNGCESQDPSGYVQLFPYREWIRNITEYKFRHDISLCFA